jgi:hypothetical protein
MTRLKCLLLRLVPGASAREARIERLAMKNWELQQHVLWLEHSLTSSLAGVTALRHELTTVADERDLCLGQLMTQVSINEHGHWTTVLDADSPLPQEMNDYLHALVQRA